MTWSEQKCLLKQLGYNSYRDYLAGVLWADIRENVFKTSGKRCYICNRTATVIHHMEYTEAVFRGENITPLIPLCWDCHQRVEYDKFGKKLSLTAANNKLKWYKENKHLWEKNKWSNINLGRLKERQSSIGVYKKNNQYLQD